MVSHQLSDELAGLLCELKPEQVRFVIARQDVSTDREAAEEIGVSPYTVASWKQNGFPIDRAIALMAHDGVVVATHLRRRALGRAMATKVAGLKSQDERLRQAVATEIVEWELGKAVDTLNVQGEWVELLRGLRDAPGDVEAEAEDV